MKELEDEMKREVIEPQTWEEVCKTLMYEFDKEKYLAGGYE